MLRLLIFVGVLGKLAFTENPIFFCKTGKELALNKVCDGLKDCEDGTDERKELCYHTM
jgi:Low-density lipoprotein receptor domain class A